METSQNQKSVYFIDDKNVCFINFKYRMTAIINIQLHAKECT